MVDTSLCYNLDPGGRSRKPKLRDLAKVFLEKDIQSCREGGHDPEEDAKATLELVHLKLKNGYKFGDTILQNGAGGGDSSELSCGAVLQWLTSPGHSVGANSTTITTAIKY